MNDNNSSQSVRAMFEEKLVKFKQRFRFCAADCGIEKELLELTVDSIYATLLSVRLFWDLIEERDESTLLTLFDLDTEQCNDADKIAKRKACLAYYENLNDDDKTWLWRYIKFFLHCVKC